MKLKDLTVELSGKDNISKRSLGIGPLSDGLSFLYGERGAGKSAIVSQIRGLLTQLVTNATTHGEACSIDVECESGRYRIERSSDGQLSTSSLNGIPGGRASHEARQSLLKLDCDFADCLAFVGFRDSTTRLGQLYGFLQNRFNVPVGRDAAIQNPDAPRIREERIDITNRIDLLRRELTQLQLQRDAVESNSTLLLSADATNDLDRKINELTLRLGELDPNRIRLELESVKQHATRLRTEIANARTTVDSPEPEQYLPTLYRLLDEIDQQIREVRVVQSNVQRHRVRLKEEMESRNVLTVEDQTHPYHRAREILRQIEVRIDNADTRGDQWLDDHGTIDAQQVSRFIDETCNSLRSDLQLLCDELSTQYRDFHNRFATHELKELRYNFTHLSKLIESMLGRRSAVLRELRVADSEGFDIIEQAAPEYCQLAANKGHLVARQHFVGPLATTTVSKVVSRDTTFEQQQLATLESRMASLQAMLESNDSESIRIRNEINDLNLQRTNLANTYLAQQRENVARIESQIRSLESNIQSLGAQLVTLPECSIAPHPVLVTASNILQHLTLGDYVRVWLSPTNGQFEVQDRQLNTAAVSTVEERGFSHLVQLALVLAANENSDRFDVPVMLDDLFSDLRKNRINPVLESLSRWSRQTSRQVIVLTQHRFLADRLPECPVWEIENEGQTGGTPISLSPVHNLPDPFDPTWERPHSEIYSTTPAVEYPRSLLPRPYPLSKYPRSSDRDRMHSSQQFEYHETPIVTEISTGSAVASYHSLTQIDALPGAEVVSPADIGDRLSITTISESTHIERISLFDHSQLRCLEEIGIGTVGEFLLLDPQSDSEELAASYLTGDTLEHLQASAWLMLWVPGITANSAQALVACGISDPEHLLTSNIDSLFERVSRFLRSPDGRRFSSASRSLSRDTVASWQNRLRNNRNYRQQSRPRWNSSRENDREHSLRAWSPNERPESDSTDRSPHQRDDRQPMPIRSPRIRTPEQREAREYEPREPRNYERRERKSQRKPAAVRQSSGRQSLSQLTESTPTSQSKQTKSKSKTAAAPKLRFYLDLSDHIEAAPSIGPKTGARFEAIGVHTIADFLKITAESLAEKLDYKRLNAKVIRQWQNQTRLVCRIPNLRGHDAQLLVGCGIVEAEELASMRPESLFAKIAPFSDTKEGLKIIRNGKKPDLEEITDWISFAQHNRSLQAA